MMCTLQDIQKDYGANITLLNLETFRLECKIDVYIIDSILLENFKTIY